MTTREREDQLLRNVAAMKASKRRFQTRLQEARRYREKIAKRFEELSAVYEIEEERFAVLDAIEDFESGVRSQLENITAEIEKIDKGFEAIHTAKGSKLKSVFMQYIIDDTNLSLKSIAMTCYEYDRIIDSVKEIEKTT